MISELRVASVNLENGGLGEGGRRRQASVAVLREMRPHLVLVQELFAPGEERVRREFRTLANALGMEPCALGQPRGSKRLRTGILADVSVLEILDDGPGSYLDAPFWAQATVAVRESGTVLDIYSVHAPATTAAGQLAEAERLATRITDPARKVPAIAGGDWNCYSRHADLGDLGALSPHLRPARMRRGLDGQLAANYDVHDVLTFAGLTDPVPLLPPDRREPPEPPGTGSHPVALIDEFFLWPGELLRAVCRYDQRPNEGSDHQVPMITLNAEMIAAAGSET